MFFLFLHADSRLPENADQAIAEALADRKPGWGWFDARLSGRAPVYRLIAAFMNLRARLTAVCTGDQALFVSAELFHVTGEFPGIPLMEDIAISKKLRKLARPRPLALKVSSSSRRWERDGVARTVLQMWRLRLLYFFGAAPEKLAARYYPRLFAAGARFKFPSARIAVFAREPEMGEVKTRLAAQIGPEAALRLYRAMLRRVVETVEQTALAEFHLWAASDPGHEEFTALCNVQDIRLQQGEDLGSRMHNAAAVELAEDGVEFVLIVGSDCPALTPDYLARALDALSAGVEVVLGPSTDGGYVLIGLRRVARELFSEVDWGGPDVLEQTLERVREAGLRHQLLESSWDVDDAEDLPLLEELRPPLSWSR